MDEKKSILIVDDVADNLTVLSELLISEGYIVRPVTSGAMALKTIQNGTPDLILLDIKMPEMDGFQVCRRIKADERLSDIPIIFISAYGDESEKIKAFEAGGVDYIIKPFHSSEVYARVKAHIEIAESRKYLSQLNYELEKKVFQRTKELEESNTQLKKSEEKFSKAFQFNPLLMAIYSFAGKRIIEVNKTSEIKLGYTREELIGLSINDLKMWQGEAPVELILETLKKNGSCKNIELALKTKSGESIMCNTAYELIDFGNEQCVLIVAEDISLRKLNEDKINAQLNELQRWYNITLNREDRVMELKEEVNILLARLNEPPRYTKL